MRRVRVNRQNRSSLGLEAGSFHWLAPLLPWIPFLFVGLHAMGQEQEEQADYFRKWLNQDVTYIIAADERDVFEKLRTDEERERFIEQFWLRRDPDPLTPSNEYKEEHYRRIAYANEHFSVGMPGWMSDRGRIYIIHGPPTQIESHPTGGQHERPSWEGGGWTQTYPWEMWRYRYIEGLGPEIEIEFVDKSMSGQYKIALNPEEKDALLRMGKSGATLAEILKQDIKRNRPSLNPLYRNQGYTRLQDTQWERYMRYARVQSPTPIKYKDLQEVVKVNLSYEQVPFLARVDYFRLSESQTLVPVTLELADKDLSFKVEGELRSAEAAVYGIVTTITNQVVEEFEDELATSFNSAETATNGMGKSLYQKVLVLENRMRYKLDLVVKDLNSGRVGVIRKALVPPKFDGGEDSLSMSSLLVSDYIYFLEDPSQMDSMFVLGDIKVRPSPKNSFTFGRPLAVYFQLYHLALDQTSQWPAISLKCTISKDGERVAELVDESGEAIQFFSDERAVLIQELPVSGLEPGKYHLEVSVEDRLANRSSTSRAEFTLEAGPAVASAANTAPPVSQ